MSLSDASFANPKKTKRFFVHYSTTVKRRQVPAPYQTSPDWNGSERRRTREEASRSRALDPLEQHAENTGQRAVDYALEFPHSTYNPKQPQREIIDMEIRGLFSVFGLKLMRTITVSMTPLQAIQLAQKLRV